jgi:hypothetical protein
VHPSQVRVPTEFLLMEGARRADAWGAIRDVVSGPRVVPTFPEMQRQQLSQLRLLPDEWEILTLVDGVRSVHDLASALRRDVVEVATTVHGLIEAGVLVLNDAPVTQRAPSMPTPLVNSSLPQDRAEQPPADSHRPDVPPVYSPEMPFSPPFDSGDDDSLFDPVQHGVMTADGMPSWPPPGSGNAWAVHSEPVVAPHHAHQSGEGKGMEAAVADDARLLRAADDAARSGDLVAAIELWSQWLALPTGEPVSAVHERISLARQLHALLHP